MNEAPKLLNETIPCLPHPVDPSWTSPSIRFWQKNFPKEPLPQPMIKPRVAREKWGSMLPELATDNALAEQVAFTVEAEARIIKAIQDRKLSDRFLPYLSDEFAWFKTVIPAVQKPVMLNCYFFAVVRHVKLGPRAGTSPIKVLGPIRMEPIANLPPMRVSPPRAM